MPSRALHLADESRRRPFRRLAARLAIPAYERLTGRRPWTKLRGLRELQWSTPAELAEVALTRLQPLLTHAATHVPHYRDVFERAGVQPRDIRTLADLARLPLSRKAELRAGFPDRVIAGDLPAARRFRTETSGSTGLPFEFFTDRADLDRRLASFLLFWEWAGVPVGSGVTQVVVSLRPAATVDALPRWIRAGRRAILGESVVPLSGLEGTPGELLDRLRSLPAGADYLLWGLPSSIARLAVQFMEHGGRLPRPPRVVVSSGETLTAPSRSAIEEAFQCRVVNHYSSYEVLHLAQTCPDQPTLMHVDDERAILRVVREDGSPAATGESGRIVITDLGNWVMPFINYDTGDWGQAGPPCPCGRGFSTLRAVEGRLGEAIRTPGGKVVSPTVLGWFLAHVRQGLPYIWEFQAIQSAPDAVVLRIVPTPRLTAAIAADLTRALEEFLGPGVAVTLQTVDRIPAEDSGKRLVIKSAAAVG